MGPLFKALREHRFLLYFSLAYMVAVSALAFALGAKLQEFTRVLGYFISADFFMLLYPVMLLSVWLVRAAFSVREKNILLWLRAVMNRFDAQAVSFFRDGAFWGGVAGLAALFPVDVFFCVGKSLIPHITTYRWDPLFAAWDRALHFGHYPHEFLMELAEKFDGAVIIDNLYLTWFLMVFLVQGWCLFADRDPVRRMRYLWTTVLSWIFIGTVMAALLASVGPIYHHDFYAGPSPYRDFLDDLRRAGDGRELKVFSIANDLLKMVRDDTVVDLNAISAMPSLHVAIAFLSVLYFWSINKVLRAFALAYFFVILAGSVLLGWHYAVDGYMSVAVVWLIWGLTGAALAKYGT